MTSISFYDTEKVPVMQWERCVTDDIEYEEYISLRICISYSIFQASVFRKVKVRHLLQFRAELTMLYREEQSVASYISEDALVKFWFQHDRNGYIGVKLLLQEEGTKSFLDIEYVTSRLALPELLDELDELLDYRAYVYDND